MSKQRVDDIIPLCGRLKRTALVHEFYNSLSMECSRSVHGRPVTKVHENTSAFQRLGGQSALSDRPIS